jgi:Uma2 family endonuclease
MLLDDPPVIDAEPVRPRLTAEEFMDACEAGVFGDWRHVELVDGEIVEMPPEGEGHARNNAQSFIVLHRIVERHPPLEITSNMASNWGRDVSSDPTWSCSGLCRVARC